MGKGTHSKSDLEVNLSLGASRLLSNLNEERFI